MAVREYTQVIKGKYDTKGSIKAMENAGYNRADTVETHGIKHLVMLYNVGQKT